MISRWLENDDDEKMTEFKSLQMKVVMNKLMKVKENTQILDKKVVRARIKVPSPSFAQLKRRDHQILIRTKKYGVDNFEEA